MNFKQLAQALAVTATLLIAQPIQAETFYFHNDHLGTPQALTDDSGTVVWQGSYSPFGEVTETTDTVEQNIRFPGQYFEEETGLHYNYFRDYDPGTGRYIESDPIGLDGGINTFGYVGGRPISRIDPTGQFDPAGFVVGVGETVVTGAGVAVSTVAAGVVGVAAAVWPSAAGEGSDITPDNQSCGSDDGCPPCDPPVGTTVYEIHTVPPAKPHWPHEGSHVHYFTMKQNPKNCRCFWKRNSRPTSELPPPEGMKPL